MRDLVIAEKPSVARDIAKVLNAGRRKDGFYEGDKYYVTWAIGHLVGISEPSEMNPQWKRWNLIDLPMIPSKWQLSVMGNTKSQFEVVKSLILGSDTATVICATDAGREGELIFRNICDMISCDKPMKRLWISSLTPSAIKQGFQNLKDIVHYNRLADSAKSRARADWLVGMNLSRAYSLLYDQNFSVGRVQTPTLAVIVNREKEIQNFKSKKYFELQSTFSPENKVDRPEESSSFSGLFFDVDDKNIDINNIKKIKAKRWDQNDAGLIETKDQVEKGKATILSIRDKKIKQPPPLFYDLTQLQRDGNRLFGFSAKKTLDIAQSLYEQKKLISYPRTDSPHLTNDVSSNIKTIINGVKAPYEGFLPGGALEKPLPRRYIDDKSAGEHHAIIPTGEDPKGRNLNREQEKIFDLICRRFFAAWHKDHIKATTIVITVVTNNSSCEEDFEHHFFSRGSRVIEQGWRAFDFKKIVKSSNGKSEGDYFSSSLQVNQKLLISDVVVLEKKTTPPPRFTDASLLTAMETAGSVLDDKELSKAMKERGLGTPATRASIIETLIDRKYVERREKSLHATSRGSFLIDQVHKDVKSPSMTGQWEFDLRKIEKGENSLDRFAEDINNYITQTLEEIVGRANKVKAGSMEKVTSFGAEVEKNVGKDDVEEIDASPCETSLPFGGDIDKILNEIFGFKSFRPHQREVCKDIATGHDLLLVMPTGAGKSLCYQLPGLARGGVTLIVSPLIALMEDQVSKLNAFGLKAACIHSGLDRGRSRQICQQYLFGDLQYLFIAPERLGVRGFPEFLGKNPPTLIAIDEAHCISHWGHDFRPDYRMLKERLPFFRNAPVVAVTATATPLVQKDICEQLALSDLKEHIHGFRRDNIAIEVAEVSSISDREELVEGFIADPKNRPAIIYCSTRNQAEQLAEKLSSTIKIKAYHAGMLTSVRNQVQREFLDDKVDAITATTAFGMGVDKANIRSVVHMSIPSSLEAYYQEIGRGGRDGKIAKAVLFYSYGDRRTHEFFHDKNYPEISKLQKVFKAIPEEGIHKSALDVDIDFDALEIVLEKLWIHGGIRYTPEELLFPEEKHWEKRYLAQKEHKYEQLKLMHHFAESAHKCRMLFLVEHFGDKSDGGMECEMCDVCNPKDGDISLFRKQTPFETQKIAKIYKYLIDHGAQPLGKFYKELFSKSTVSRPDFENWIRSLIASSYLFATHESFSKNGVKIDYRVIDVSSEGRDLSKAQLAEIPIYERKNKKSSNKILKEDKKPVTKLRKKRAQGAVASDPDNKLVERLRNWRRKEAEKRKIPAFCIFPDRTLKAIADKQPKSESELLMVSGIGDAKANQFGKFLLKIVNEYSSSKGSV